MRHHDKQWQTNRNHDLFGVDFHSFMALESQTNYMEIAQEFGISIGQVKQLKKQITRT
ncbi:hypothetical protein JNUCC1_03410 [Lentibacillus sp. JNUCC-1]|uniref:hypothetical protein n=1 Tax=Lentibacillus sp. JNUCC-1 TaxID=2654513 RepID=UPI001321F128|nr:hypothetical protein [Lentibacillus sp. JNUCC-1]MUV39532.1 hypothetical protein [Lentibacillus sp. JNUCC-1]